MKKERLSKLPIPPAPPFAWLLVNVTVEPVIDPPSLNSAPPAAPPPPQPPPHCEPPAPPRAVFDVSWTRVKDSVAPLALNTPPPPPPAAPPLVVPLPALALFAVTVVSCRASVPAL